MNSEQVQSPVENVAATTEKMFSQEEVNSIVGNRAREAAEKAAEKARREAEAAYQSQLNEIKQSQAKSTTQSPETSQHAEQQMEAFFQRKRQEEEERAFAEHMQNIANDFQSKVRDPSLKERYEDYDSVITSTKMEKYPNVVLMANEMPNTADVFYFLLKNPSKLLEIEAGARNVDPDLAKSIVKKISNELASNESSKAKYKKEAEPLSRMKPTSVGADNGQPSVRDFKKKFKF